MSANESVQITFRGFRRSEAIEQVILEHASWLEKYAYRLLSCRVCVEKPHRHHAKGNLFHLRIELATPGKRLVITHNGKADHAHEDLNVTVRDAFFAARRRLEDQARQRRDRHRIPVLAMA